MSPFLVLALTAKSGPFEQTLPSGTRVFLSYVGKGKDGICWRPDGHPTDPFWSNHKKDLLGGHVLLHEGDLELILTLKLKKIPPDLISSDKNRWAWQPAVAEIEPTHLKAYGIYTVPTRLTKDEWWIQRIVAHPSSQTFDATVRVADLDWKEVALARFRNGKKVSGGEFVGKPVSLFQSMGDEAFPCKIPVRWQNYDWKLLSFDRAGVVLTSVGKVIIHDKTYAFFSGFAKNVDKVKLMVRPWNTVHFKNIHAQPDIVENAP